MAAALEQPPILDVKRDIPQQTDKEIKCKKGESEAGVEVVEVEVAEDDSGEHIGVTLDGVRGISSKGRPTLFTKRSLKEAWIWPGSWSNGAHVLPNLRSQAQRPDHSAVGSRAVGEILESERSRPDLLINNFFPYRPPRDVMFIFVIGAITHFLTSFGCGWDWLLILLAFSFTYHVTSTNRFLRHFRDDAIRNAATTRLANSAEHVEWINHILERLWPIYEPVIAAETNPRVNKILSTNLPTHLDSLYLSEFTLGVKSIRVLEVKTYPDTPANVVTMDWKFHFDPDRTLHRTHRTAKSRTNSRITLSAGIAGLEVPIIVKDISLSGWLRVRLTLAQEYPRVKTLEVSFVEKPALHFALIPVGGDTFGFDIADFHILGISTFLQDKVHSTLSSMYHPNQLTLNVEELLPDNPLNSIFGNLMSTFFPTLNSPF